MSTANVSALWKEPTSNVKPITIHPSNLGPNYQYPAGQTKITWSVSNSAGSDNCITFVTVKGKARTKEGRKEGGGREGAMVHEILKETQKGNTFVFA